MDKSNRCNRYRIKIGTVEELVELMLDVICSTKPYQQINGEAVPTQVVKSRLLKVWYEHIQYVFFSLSRSTSKVRRKNYVEIFDKIAISNYCSFCLAGTCSGEYCIGKEQVSEIEKKYQELLETLSPEQEEVITEYCNAIFSSGAETEEFFYRLGLKDGLNLKNAVKFVLEMIS